LRKSLFIQFAAILLIPFLYLFTQPALAEIGPLIKGPIFDPVVPDKISIRVDISDFRKFQVSLMKAKKTEIIQDRSKKKISATFSWEMPGKGIEVHKGKFRLHGYGGDHIQMLDKFQLISSLSVKLKTGNLGGITKFKLLLPSTRGNDNEVFVTTLLEKIGLIAPYTRYMNVNFNGTNIRMLFQEVAAKELLERYSLREAPIIEGDERQFWSNTSLAGGRTPRPGCCFSKIDNSGWLRSDTHNKITQNALARWAQLFLNTRPSPLTNLTHLDDVISSRDEIQVKINDASFREFLWALSANHALGAHNRKFYYDPTFNKLIPIYYDGYGQESKIALDLIDTILLDTINPRYLKRIAQPDFQQNVLNSFLSRGGQDVKLVKAILEKLILNVKKHSREEKTGLKRKILEERVLKYNLGSRTYPYSFTTWQKDKGDLLCVIGVDNNEEKNIIVADIAFENFKTIKCKEIDNALAIRAMRGKVSFLNKSLEGIPIHVSAIGNSVTDEQGLIPRQFFDNKLIEFSEDQIPQNAEILVEEGSTLWVRIKSDAETPHKVLNLKLMGHNRNQGRVILSGNLVGLSEIKVEGEEIIGNDKRRVSTAPVEPALFDDRLLTGCITIIDADMSDLKITAKSMACEDAINIVRSKGKGVEISVSQATSDALDVDFSTVHFAKISISDAGNDCVDFSAGTYTVDMAVLINCGDKGISVGEQAKAEIKTSYIDGADIGIASKDASDVLIGKSNINNTRICLAAYKKKQEFNGAKLQVNEKPSGCPETNFVDQHSAIIFN